MKKSPVTKKAAPKGAKPLNVDDYLASAPEEMRPMLQKLRATIKSAAPKAEECISYGIPTYKLNGPLVHFLVRKDYCSLVTVTRSVIAMFKSELGVFDVSGTTIHFTPDNQLTSALVKKIVKARIKENEALAKTSKPKTKSK